MTNPDSQDLSDDPDISIVNDPAASRYQLRVDGAAAGSSAYVVRDDVIVFTHTEVDPAHEGKGLASRLVRAALDDVRTSGGVVQAECSYVAAWIDKHPDYQDLLVP